LAVACRIIGQTTVRIKLAHAGAALFSKVEFFVAVKGGIFIGACW
jgi:hypothetical protein